MASEHQKTTTTAEEYENKQSIGNECDGGGAGDRLSGTGLGDL